MRIVYFGSPDSAVAPLDALQRAGHRIELVVSGADKRRGRGSAKSPTPVKARALELGLEVSEDMRDALAVAPDLGVVVAYGRIVPRDLLEAFPFVNIHFSLLPRWRGAAPVERAILAGDSETGVSLMALEEGLDTGPVFRRVSTPIDATETAAALRERLAALGAELLVRALAEGLGDPVPQDDAGATYAAKITSEDRQLRAGLSGEEFIRRVRIGGAWTTFRGKRLKVISAAVVPGTAAGDANPGAFLSDTRLAVGDGVVELLEVQPEGRQVMAAADWGRGARPSGESIAT